MAQANIYLMHMLYTGCHPEYGEGRQRCRQRGRLDDAAVRFRARRTAVSRETFNHSSLHASLLVNYHALLEKTKTKCVAACLERGVRQV